MKKILLINLLFILFITSFGQSEKTGNKMAADEFEKNYNGENYEAIFYMFGKEMQNALPLIKTKEFLAGLNIQAGKIKKRQFLKYERGSFASYKTNFERALLTVDISIDKDSKINGLFVKAFTDETLPKLERNISKLQLPLNGEWTVIWGGDTKELNYHVESVAQKNAFDLVIKGNSGLTYKTNGQANEDYYAFGKEILAPCDGTIVLVVDGVKDNKPGDLNPIYIPGNTVIIKTLENEYLFFAHFKKHSIKVGEGQKINKGQVLGLCGNSGNSSEPHLHFHIQNVEDMNIATGAKCYFEKIMVNGEIKKDYSPIKGDKIKNL